MSEIYNFAVQVLAGAKTRRRLLAMCVLARRNGVHPERLYALKLACLMVRKGTWTFPAPVLYASGGPDPWAQLDPRIEARLGPAKPRKTGRMADQVRARAHFEIGDPLDRPWPKPHSKLHPVWSDLREVQEEDAARARGALPRNNTGKPSLQVGTADLDPEVFQAVPVSGHLRLCEARLGDPVRVEGRRVVNTVLEGRSGLGSHMPLRATGRTYKRFGRM